MPARRSFLVLGLATLLVGAGVLRPALAMAGWILDGLLLLAFLVDWRRAVATPLAARRVWPPLLAQGTAAELVTELRIPAAAGEGGRGGGPAVEVVVREALHPALAERSARRRLRIPRGAPLRWAVALAPRRRGEHPVGPCTARVLGPWGLAWSQRRLLSGEPRRVYPRIRWEGEVGRLLALAQRHRLGQTPHRLQGSGTEPYGVRDYLPGDPLHRIHWRATARHGRLISREDTWERGARLVILLDAGRAMASLDDSEAGLGGSANKLDHALATALALVRVAAARGDAVTLAAFSDRVERTVRLHSGSRGMPRAYERFYDLEARLVEPAYDLAVETAFELESRGGTVVLLTSVVDLAAAELLRESVLRLERRHRTLLVHLEDSQIGHLVRSEPEDVPGAFAQVAAMEILLANRRLAAELRRAGVRAVTTPADRLALTTLETYLALFRSRAEAVRRRVGSVG